MTSASLQDRLAHLEALFFDCDGVLTPGDLIYDDTGRRLLRFHARDGIGLILLRNAGIRTAVISGRNTDIARHRFFELGVHHFQGQCRHKDQALRTLAAELNIEPEKIAFVGDDLPDLAAFAAAGLAIAVADAAEEVKAQADLVLTSQGGYGAIREIAEAILKASNRWNTTIATFSEKHTPP